MHHRGTLYRSTRSPTRINGLFDQHLRVVCREAPLRFQSPARINGLFDSRVREQPCYANFRTRFAHYFPRPASHHRFYTPDNLEIQSRSRATLPAQCYRAKGPSQSDISLHNPSLTILRFPTRCKKESPARADSPTAPDIPFRRPRNGIRLTREGLEIFLRAYEQRLTAKITHPRERARLTYRQCFGLQVRHLAAYLRGKVAAYEPFRWR